MFGKPRRTSTLILLFFISQLLLSGQELTSEQQEEVTTLVNMQRDWGEKLNSPGARLELREIKREKQGNKQMVVYHMYATGLPSSVRYEIHSAPIHTNPQQSLVGVTLDESGRAICGGRQEDECGTSSKPDDPIDLTFFPIAGEPYRILLTSNRGTYKAAISVVPIPISSKDKNCQVSIVRLLPKFELALAEGKGFFPESEVRFEGNSAGEVRRGQVRSDKDGNWHSALLPFVKGKQSGQMHLKVASKTCNQALIFKWGTTD